MGITAKARGYFDREWYINREIETAYTILEMEEKIISIEITAETEVSKKIHGGSAHIQPVWKKALQHDELKAIFDKRQQTL